MKFPKKKYSEINKFYFNYIDNLNICLRNMNLSKLKKISKMIEDTVKNKKKIFICGNGGSAAVANHYVADYLKLLRTNTKLKPKIISLVSNMELITAISNDLNYDQIFSYQLESLAEKNDLLILISASGNSKNLINAQKFSKKIKMKSISFLGFNGGKLLKMSDVCFHAKINNYGISEDLAHIFMHIIIQFLRQKNLSINLKKVKF
tara:strand:+ start:3214 stop:3831 length:618 start_codon:yes stop_codon:yes gene_type:complete